MGTEKKEKKKYEFNGKQYDRKEYVRLLRAEKKEKLRKYREGIGLFKIFSKISGILWKIPIFCVRFDKNR